MPKSPLWRYVPLVLSLAFAVGLRAAPQDAPQSVAKAPAFEVASVKLVRDCPSGGGRPVLNPGHVDIPCINVRTLIRVAYSAFTDSEMAARIANVVGGPAWIDSDNYQIAAKTPGPAAAPDILGPMLRAVLEDRFKLKVRREPRENSVYFLTVAEGGPVLPRMKEGDCVPMDIFAEANVDGGPRTGPAACGVSRGTMKEGVMAMDWTGVTMEEFAGRGLTGYADRPVVDKTGLAGRFNLHLEFVPPRPQGMVLLNGQPTVLPPASEDPGRSIYTALQKQLGLKLSPGKAPIDVIVVDSIERPSEN